MRRRSREKLETRDLHDATIMPDPSDPSFRRNDDDTDTDCGCTCDYRAFDDCDEDEFDDHDEETSVSS